MPHARTNARNQSFSGWRAGLVGLGCLTAVGLVLNAVPTSTQGSPASQLQNGGFEEFSDGVPVGWSSTGSDLRVVGSGRTGAASGVVTATSIAEAVIYQEIAVGERAVVHWHGYLRLTDSLMRSVLLRATPYLQVSDGPPVPGTSFKTVEYTGHGPDWIGATLVFTSPAQTAYVRVAAVGIPDFAGASFEADDFSLSATAGQTSTPTATAIASPTFGLTSTANPAITPTSGSTPTTTPSAARTVTPTGTPPPVAAPLSVGSLLIAEVMANAIGSPDDSHEWVELFNPAPLAITIVDCTIEDNVALIDLPSNLHIAGFGRLVVAASTLFLDDYPDFSGEVVFSPSGRIGNGLRDGGDRIIIRCSSVLIDAISYGDDDSVLQPSIPAPKAGRSLERRPENADCDQAIDWTWTDTPTPGRSPSIGSRRVQLPFAVK